MAPSAGFVLRGGLCIWNFVFGGGVYVKFRRCLLRESSFGGETHACALAHAQKAGMELGSCSSGHRPRSILTAPPDESSAPRGAGCMVRRAVTGCFLFAPLSAFSRPCGGFVCRVFFPTPISYCVQVSAPQMTVGNDSTFSMRCGKQ